MSNESKTAFDGFDSFFNQVDPSMAASSGNIQGEEEMPLTDPEDIETNPEEEKTEEVSEEVDSTEDTSNNEEEEVQEESTDETESDDLSDIEPDLVNFLNDKLSNKFDFGEESPKSLEEFIEMFDQLAEESSMPQYPSNEMEELHKFVENGGNLQDYFSLRYKNVDIENLDIDKESNQKAVVTELLKEKGYSESRIGKMITRYEDAGVLQEEAEDALEELKELNEKTSKQLLKQQEEFKTQQIEQQRKFASEVQSYVDNLKDIKGVSISKKENKELLDYIFKPDSDGLTAYQKEYQKNLVQNLVESAYFTKNKDKFANSLEKKATSKAALNLKNKLRDKGRASRSTDSSSRGATGSKGSFNSIYDFFAS